MTVDPKETTSALVAECGSLPERKGKKFLIKKQGQSILIQVRKVGTFPSQDDTTNDSTLCSEEQKKGNTPWHDHQ
jgi:hypothetical protein